MAEETLTPDLCVIGGGAAGIALATAAAAFGVRVVLVERDRVGASRLHRGSVPSNALIAAAKRAFSIRRAADFGIGAGEPEIDFGRIRDYLKRTIAMLEPNESERHVAALGVRVVKGEARFVDASTLAAGGLAIRARRFVLATGSAPVAPPIPGLADTPYLTSDTIFDLGERPRHLLVLGSGSTALELAQAFRRLGAAVTVLATARPLADEDSECAGNLLDALAREGISMRSNVGIDRIERDDESVRVFLSSAGAKESVEGSHLLLAAGRRPDVHGLGLEAAGIAHDPDGIHVGIELRTANERVFAIGDAAGGLQYTHVARWHARLVLQHILFRWPIRAIAESVPRVIFTDPEIAHIGLIEEEARLRHGEIRVLRSPFCENDRAAIGNEGKGMVKVVTTRWGRIVGVTIVGARASELISTWVLALATRTNIRTVAGLVLPYPTLSEASRDAAFAHLGRGLTNRWVRRIIRALRTFG